MLNRRKLEVQLFRYDLSNGKAKWLTPFLVGHSIAGIWHTGIVVCGKEYWFGGHIFESERGTTPFGTPTQIQTLGETMRTREDLWNFIQTSLVDEFTEANYDVLTHNCNHFSNTISKFLLNESLPDEIMKQPDIFMDSWIAQVLRPTLNRGLGTFGPEQGGAEGFGGGRATGSSAKTDWQRVEVGALVSYEYVHGWPCVARVLGKAGETCDVRWLDLAARQFKVQKGVSRLLVRPLSFAKPSHWTRTMGAVGGGGAQAQGLEKKEQFRVVQFMEEQLRKLTVIGSM